LFGIVCDAKSTKNAYAKLRKCEKILIINHSMNKEEDNKIIYKDLSYKIFGICLEVHSILGNNCREKQYCDLFEKLLIRDKVEYEREKDISYFLKENKIGGNRVDFIIEERILFEGKTKRFITREDYVQVKRYLEATNLKLGIIVNFRDKRIKTRRVINSKAKE